MTILQALDSYYHRLQGIAQPGWAPMNFGWCIVIDDEGKIVAIDDLRDLSGKKPKIKRHIVPVSDAVAKRTSGIAANIFCDKSAYVLGRTAKYSARTAKEHAHFVQQCLDCLDGQTDRGLIALRRFVENWQPENFDSPPFTAEMLDANFMFQLEGEREYLHERDASRALLSSIQENGDASTDAFCLVTGSFGPVARLHRDIMGVEDAQPSGAPLVSCNGNENPAFSSYRKSQGFLAPTGRDVAFRYATALNHLLAWDSPNRIRRKIGDATVVFWADASNAKAAQAADAWFAKIFTGDITDEQEAAKIRIELDAVSLGRPLASLDPAIEAGTRFHVLGLSPNAARLSVRFWMTDSLDDFARRLAEHHADLEIDPRPMGWGAAPSVYRLLSRTTALQEKPDNIPRNLVGEVMRSILSGGRYPQSLLALTIARLRAGDDPGRGWHAAVIRAVLVRDARLCGGKDDIPMSLNKDSTDQAYSLGRLFAALEHVQEQAIEGVKATIRGRFLASASAAPASVFPTLLRLSQHHIVKLAGMTNGAATTFHDRQIQEIFQKIPDHFPRSLKLTEQGRFYIGYYHQRAERFRKRDGKAVTEIQGNEDGE